MFYELGLEIECGTDFIPEQKSTKQNFLVPLEQRFECQINCKIFLVTNNRMSFFFFSKEITLKEQKKREHNFSFLYITAKVIHQIVENQQNICICQKKGHTVKK